MEIYLLFGGFFDSAHEALIESMLESFFDDDQFYDNYDVDYHKVYEEYAKAWLIAFNDWLMDNNYIKKRLEYKGMWHPKYYTGEESATEKIVATMDDVEAKRLSDNLLTDDEFLERLREYTKSRSGHISSFDYHEALNNKDNCLISYVLRFLCDKFNDVFFDLEDFGDFLTKIDNFYQVLEE